MARLGTSLYCRGTISCSHLADGMFRVRFGIGKQCQGRRAGELCGGLGHALAEPVTITRWAAKHGRMLLELCPGLSLLRRFKCHPSKHAFAATAGAQITVPVCLLLAAALMPPITGAGGVPGSGLVPQLDSQRWRWDPHWVSVPWLGSA